jgi:hypothetical protein
LLNDQTDNLPALHAQANVSVKSITFQFVEVLRGVLGFHAFTSAKWLLHAANISVSLILNA